MPYILFSREKEVLKEEKREILGSVIHSYIYSCNGTYGTCTLVVSEDQQQEVAHLH